MAKKILFLFLTVCIASSLLAQLQWQESGIALNYDYPLYWYSDGGVVQEGISYYAWSESQSGNPDLYMQGYDVFGNSVWQQNILICNADKYQGRPQIIAASDGNLILSWQDTRNIPGLYFGDGYDIYMQKITPDGEFLWEENGIMAGACGSYDYNIVSDEQGGCYLAFQSNSGIPSFWHFDECGECVLGWEEGIILENNDYNYIITTDSTGNLIICSTHSSGCKVRKLSSAGELIWNDIVVTDYYTLPVVKKHNALIDIFFKQAHQLFLQQIDEDGEPLYDEPVFIYGGDDNISSLLVASAHNAYYLCFYQNEAGNILMKVDYTGQVIWSDTLDISQSFQGMKGMINGNVRLWEDDSSSFTIWEFNENGEFVSPEEGWWNYEYPEDYWNYQIGVFSDGENTSCGWRVITPEVENEVLFRQTITETGLLTYENEGAEVSSGRNSGQLCRGVFKINNLEVVLMQTDNDLIQDRRMIMKMFDEDGSIVCGSEGIPISSENSAAALPLGVFEQRLYFIMKLEDQSNPSSYNLYLNAVDFNEEPSLVWSESGIYLGEGKFSNTSINMTRLPEDDALLICWNLDSPHGYVRIQKLADLEFIWQEGGLIYPFPDSDTYTVKAYNDYILRTVSWGNGHYLSRVNDNGNMLWAEEIPFQTELMYLEPIAIPLENSNMLFLYAEHTYDGFILVEHRITPDGQDLSGNVGDVVAFFNDFDELRIFDLSGSYAVVAWQDEGNIVLRRFNYNGEEIADPVEIELYEYYDLIKVELLNEHLLVYTTTIWGGQKLAVWDFNGNASDLLPENPYQFLDNANFGSFIFTCKEEDDIYFCWLEGGTSERPAEGEFGWNWHMQKFRIPTTDNNYNEISPLIETQFFPNPFNPELNICWQIDSKVDDTVNISIYNLRGQLVNRWENQAACGNIIWDALSKEGTACPTGIYFIRFKLPSISQCHKVVLMK